MILTINGDTKEAKDGSDLLQIIQELKIEDKVMAAAVNMNIVKKDSWAEYKPQDGDVLELLHFVGGG